MFNLSENELMITNGGGLGSDAANTLGWGATTLFGAAGTGAAAVTAGAQEFVPLGIAATYMAAGTTSYYAAKTEEDIYHLVTGR
jgi:hypothetical protein